MSTYNSILKEQTEAANEGFYYEIHQEHDSIGEYYLWHSTKDKYLRYNK